jgi:hypothetical protein
VDFFLPRFPLAASISRSGCPAIDHLPRSKTRNQLCQLPSPRITKLKFPRQALHGVPLIGAQSHPRLPTFLKSIMPLVLGWQPPSPTILLPPVYLGRLMLRTLYLCSHRGSYVP